MELTIDEEDAEMLSDMWAKNTFDPDVLKDRFYTSDGHDLSVYKTVRWYPDAVSMVLARSYYAGIGLPHHRALDTYADDTFCLFTNEDFDAFMAQVRKGSE